MRLGVVLADAHPRAVDPRSALERDREFIAAARERVDAVTLCHRWSAAGPWNLHPISYAAFLAGETADLHVTVRGIPLGVLNPVEVAEQLATLDHAYAGRFTAGVTVGSDAAFRVYGIEPAVGLARFEESLGIVRKMWAALPFAAEGPQFRFAEVRPTLRPFRPGGPPVSWDARDAAGAAAAARYGLGLHVEHGTDPAVRSAVAADYRSAGGSGPASVEIDFDQATGDGLRRLREEGFDEVDVRVRRLDDPPATALRRLDELAAGARAAAGR